MGKLSFKDKVVVVTGAASGIGAAICQRFAAAGAKIGLLDMDEAGVTAAAARLQGAGADAVGIKCDVADEAQCTAAVAAVIKRFGGVDLLVNNAGITQRSAFVDTKISVYRKVMDVNFYGSLNCTRALGGDGQVTAHPQSVVGKPTSAAKVAAAIYQGALKKRHLLVLTAVGKLAYWISRLTPVLYERLMARQVKAELDR